MQGNIVQINVSNGGMPKLPVPEAEVHRLGLGNDVHAHPHIHGGPNKAVLIITEEGIDELKSQGFPVYPGAMGENLTLAGVAENELWIGDVLRFPGCQLAVSEPRFPCFKFNAAMGFRHAAKLMIESAWCGTYLAVRVPGTIAAGQSFSVVPGPREVGIAELFRARMSRAAAS